MGVFLHIALRNLVQARRRTLFLAVALSLVMTLLVLLMSFSAGLSATMIRSATTLSSGHVNVAGFFKAKASDARPIVTQKSRIREIVERDIEGVDHVVDRSRGWARVISDVSSLNAALTGVDAAEEGQLFRTLQLAKESEYKEGGREEVIGDPKDLSKKNGALIFAAQAKRLEVEVGDVVTISVETMQGMRNTAEFEIVAVAQDLGVMSNWSVFTAKEGLLELYRLGHDVTGAVQIYLDDPERSTEVMERLRATLEAEGYTLMEHDARPFWTKFDVVGGEEWTGQRLDLTIWSDEVSYLSWVLTAVDSVSFLLIGILVIIIGVGIMNSMWMSVRERTAEIGTLRAVGMSRPRVLLMFLLEALILGLCATALGGVLGCSVAALVDLAELRFDVQAIRLILMSDTLHLVVEPMRVVVAVGAFTFIAGLSALWPAYRASRMQPVTAIQHIG